MHELKLSQYFSLSDLTASSRASCLRITEQFCPPPAVIKSLTYLCEYLLEPLSALYPSFRITSGYRCPRLNAHVGGSVNSDHMSGCAVDFTGVSPTQMRQFLKRFKFDQCILYKGYIHLSLRDVYNRNQLIDRTEEQ